MTLSEGFPLFGMGNSGGNIGNVIRIDRAGNVYLGGYNMPRVLDEVYGTNKRPVLVKWVAGKISPDIGPRLTVALLRLNSSGCVGWFFDAGIYYGAIEGANFCQAALALAPCHLDPNNFTFSQMFDSDPIIRRSYGVTEDCRRTS